MAVKRGLRRAEGETMKMNKRKLIQNEFGKLGREGVRNIMEALLDQQEEGRGPQPANSTGPACSQ